MHNRLGKEAFHRAGVLYSCCSTITITIVVGKNYDLRMTPRSVYYYYYHNTITSTSMYYSSYYHHDLVMLIS